MSKRFRRNWFSKVNEGFLRGKTLYIASAFNSADQLGTTSGKTTCQLTFFLSCCSLDHKKLETARYNSQYGFITPQEALSDMIAVAYVEHMDAKMARLITKPSLSGSVHAIASRRRILYKISDGPVTRKTEIADSCVRA